MSLGHNCSENPNLNYALTLQKSSYLLTYSLWFCVCVQVGGKALQETSKVENTPAPGSSVCRWISAVATKHQVLLRRMHNGPQRASRGSCHILRSDVGSRLHEMPYFQKKLYEVLEKGKIRLGTHGL